MATITNKDGTEIYYKDWQGDFQSEGGKFRLMLEGIESEAN